VIQLKKLQFLELNITQKFSLKSIKVFKFIQNTKLN